MEPFQYDGTTFYKIDAFYEQCRRHLERDILVDDYASPDCSNISSNLAYSEIEVHNADICTNEHVVEYDMAGQYGAVLTFQAAIQMQFYSALLTMSSLASNGALALKSFIVNVTGCLCAHLLLIAHFVRAGGRQLLGILGVCTTLYGVVHHLGRSLHISINVACWRSQLYFDSSLAHFSNLSCLSLAYISRTMYGCWRHFKFYANKTYWITEYVLGIATLPLQFAFCLAVWYWLIVHDFFDITIICFLAYHAFRVGWNVCAHVCVSIVDVVCLGWKVCIQVPLAEFYYFVVFVPLNNDELHADHRINK